MTMNSWGQLLGLLGAIVLAIGSKVSTRRLATWIGFLEVTVLHVVHNQKDVPVFTGNDEAHDRDRRMARHVETAGWLVLIAGFGLQFVASLP